MKHSLNRFFLSFGTLSLLACGSQQHPLRSRDGCLEKLAAFASQSAPASFQTDRAARDPYFELEIQELSFPLLNDRSSAQIRARLYNEANDIDLQMGGSLQCDQEGVALGELEEIEASTARRPRTITLRSGDLFRNLEFSTSQPRASGRMRPSRQ